MASYSASTDSEDKSGLFRRLQKLFRVDREFSATWRKDAKEDFDFVAGEQYSEEDKAHLKSLMRPVIVMNRTHTILNAVSGQEMASRQETRYIPREPGDVKPNELLTEAARWFYDSASGDDENSEAFLNTAICGMGWVDTTLTYEQDEAGEPEMAAVSPIEMYWDRNARKNNLTDSKRVWRVKQIPRSDARELFPDADPAQLDAAWARSDVDEAETKNQDRERLYQDDGSDPDTKTDDDPVTIVHCQYIEKRKAWDVISPLTGETQEMSDADYKTYTKRAGELGLRVKAARKSKRVILDCWLGGEVLQSNDALVQDKFRYQCITGYRDENKGTFYGLVRGMKDPQRWANKWLSQTLDIMNSNAKGGVFAERGVTDDAAKFEKDYAKPDRVTWLDDGSLSGPNGPRVMPKTPGAFPAGFYQLMEFAFQMIQTVPGISPELLGQADRDQPASLEYQRRQAGMTILQPLFKNLKRYRKEQGHVVLFILQNHMSDGRLIRVLGDGQAQYVPLMKQADVKYDIIVDEMPTSPNQKEMIWSMIGERFWEMPMEMQVVFIKYSPFPETVVEEFQQIAEQQSQSAMAQLQQKMAELEAQVLASKDMLQQAQAHKAEADAQAALQPDGTDPAMEHQHAMHELAVKERESQGKLALKAGETRANIQLEREKAGAQIGLQREKQAGEMAMAQQRQSSEMAMQHHGMMHETGMKERVAGIDAAIRERESRDKMKIAARKPAPRAST